MPGDKSVGGVSSVVLKTSYEYQKNLLETRRELELAIQEKINNIEKHNQNAANELRKQGLYNFAACIFYGVAGALGIGGIQWERVKKIADVAPQMIQAGTSIFTKFSEKNQTLYNGDKNIEEIHLQKKRSDKQLTDEQLRQIFEMTTRMLQKTF